MTLQPLKIKIIPIYRWRRDAHYASRTRWVFQRTVKFVITAVATGERDLDEDITTLTNGLRLRQPLSDFMNGLNLPSLTNQPNTLYSRANNIAGSDYESLPESVYDWKVIDVNKRYNEQDNVYNTIFTIAGQWDKYQGVEYGVVRRER